MSEVRIYRSRKAFDSEKPFLLFDTEKVSAIKVAEYMDEASSNSYCFKLTVDDKEFAFCYGKSDNRDEYLSRLLLAIEMIQEHNMPLVDVIMY
ncbi:hypothetical protein D3Y59_12325 [Hymenobacter oligotrophus]|uniref:Uncharacterized protein n=1 Tax=Hymenobacter oligotrophus TaxID=2319843 RepID=A0A3B7R2W8_9BACT|nr:hypothetical protein [Hymenobacter oligotrophus]AYA37763.1 hypothetical protein D3Y59_12325 [Hymenobacter oligotrophus]